MELRQFPRDLRVRIRQYFKYFLARKTVYDERAVMSMLSTQLQQEVSRFYMRVAVKDLRFFEGAARSGERREGPLTRGRRQGPPLRADRRSRPEARLFRPAPGRAQGARPAHARPRPRACPAPLGRERGRGRRR